MHYVLSLIAERGATEISPATLDLVNTICEDAGACGGAWRWLCPGLAAERDLEGDVEGLLGRLRLALSDRPIDVNLLDAADRRKAILVSDMDATAIEGETLDDLSTFTPFKAEIDDLTRRSVEGSMGFAETLLKRVEMLCGLREEALGSAHALVRPSRGVKTLVATMRAHGALTALVSGGFRYFTARVRKSVGFDLDFANELEIVDGRLTGRLAAPIIDPMAKMATVRLLARQKGLTPGQALAVGDGSNDIPMLGEAGLGVAYRGKEKVRAAIPVQINRADLTGLLYLQGYHRDEFVETPEQ
jgi:phosphoserine phosphatase